MKFKTDENLPREVVGLLRQEGYDTLSVVDQQLSGHPDSDVAQACEEEKRALITLDLDFADIQTYPPENYSGIVVLRPRLQTVLSIVRLTTRAVALLGAEPLAGNLWIVDEHQVRIRSSDQ